MKDASKINPAKTLAKLSVIVLGLGSTIALSEIMFAQGVWIILPLAVIIAVWVQLAIQEELHDGAHYRLLKKRWANEWLALIYGYSIGFSLPGFRQLHLRHHRYFGTPEDPDFVWYSSCPIGTSAWIRYLLRNFLLINALVGLFRGELPSKISDSSKYDLLARMLVQLVILIIYSIFVNPVAYFVIWLIPLLTISYGIGKVRTLLEHWSPEPWTHPITGTTAVGAFFNFKSGLQSQLFGAPFGYNYHATHHQLPAIPNYSLGYLPEDYPQTFPAFLIKDTTYFARIRDIVHYASTA